MIAYTLSSHKYLNGLLNDVKGAVVIDSAEDERDDEGGGSSDRVAEQRLRLAAATSLSLRRVRL